MKIEDNNSYDQENQINNLNLLKISTINYGEDDVYLTSKEISDLL